jgi:hypothetical protein
VWQVTAVNAITRLNRYRDRSCRIVKGVASNALNSRFVGAEPGHLGERDHNELHPAQHQGAGQRSGDLALRVVGLLAQGGMPRSWHGGRSPRLWLLIPGIRDLHGGVTQRPYRTGGKIISCRR